MPQLAEWLSLPLEKVTEVVNRGDLSRLPWSSKATISNICGAGYGSIASLAGADHQKVFADYMDHGEKIGKKPQAGQ